jgi:predicted acyl esterase
MSDGARISLTLYLPDAPGDGPFPAVVESLPYRKDDDCFERDYQTYTYLAGRGIAGVRVDIRGTGASTGVIADEYVPREQQDNLEILAWLAEQAWCTGRLGMWGISWGGFSALQTAMLRPPQLGAIVAMHATHDRFACDVHYTGGSAHAAEQLDWPGSMVTTNALPPDPEIFGDGWYEEWMLRLERTPQWPFEWLRHQHRDAYWLHGSPIADYDSILCPTLLVGGWLDGYVDGMLALAENLSCPTRAIIGPWGHYRPATGVPGPTFDHYELLARWFAHHLRGDDNGVMAMPPLTLYVRGDPPYETGLVPGRWRAESSWPPGDTTVARYPLSDLAHDRLTWSGPQWVGRHAPHWDRAGFDSSDSAEDDAASICFETSPLIDSMEILGAPVVKLRLSTDRDVGLVAARLIAVDPDGHGHLICRASRNLAFPRDLSDPEPPDPGEPIDIELRLWETSATLPAGWRIRLAIAGADFPVVWPPKESFTLDLDVGRSWLELPTVPPRDEPRYVDLPEMGDPPSAPVRSTRSVSEREVVSDGDESIFRRVRGSSEVQPGLLYSTDQTWAVGVSQHDPATTRVSTESWATLERPGWKVSTWGTIEISGAADFLVRVEMAAWHTEKEIFRRIWEETIPRVWV